MVEFKKHSWRARFPQQFAALMKKNALMAWRNKRATLLRILAPCIFIVLVLLLDYAVRADANQAEEYRELRTPGRTNVGGIPECDSDIYIKSPCYDFIYSPNTNEDVQTIVSNIRSQNSGRPIPEDRVIGFPNMEEANAWLLENQEKTPGGIHFSQEDGAPSTIDFVLQVNTTTKFFRGKAQNAVDFIQLPLQVAAHREITRHIAPDDDPLQSFEVGWKIFPHPINVSESVVGTLMSLFLFISFMFGFVIMMTVIIGERESNISQALTTIGMMRSSYWLSWIVWEIIQAFVITIICLCFGAAVGIDFFRKNSFGNQFFTVFLFQLAMVGFAYFLASFIRKSSTAISIGFAIFLVGFIFNLVVNFGVPYDADYYTKWGSSLTIIFSAFPWSPFAKAIQDLGDATIDSSKKGISWANRSSYCDGDCRMPLPTAWGVLIAHFFIYSLLAVYLTAVLPDKSGVRDPPFFFLMPSYWMPQRYKSNIVSRSAHLDAPVPQEIDEDVAAEAQKMKNRLEMKQGLTDTNAADAAIEVFGLQRRFGSGSSAFWAVCDSWFDVPQKQLFCLLGPNGAGKSTTINILTGVLPPSGGDAVMIGESVRSPGGMGEIRSNIGVCPQFDVLWDELSAREHLQLFASIKGIATKKEIMEQTESLLSEVQLTYAAKQRAGSFSGGMKRRLSVALALLGDPSIVFLDEPTTGMDPVSRRSVWDIIERAKQNRAIVLTTHSMEEADILGDRIAIMAKGSLRCIGSSLRLKQKFGAGYQISVAVKDVEGDTRAVVQQRAEAVKAFIKDQYRFEPISENAAYITYQIAKQDEDRLPGLLRDLETNANNLQVSDTQIALTTLEEVFMQVATKAEIEAAHGQTFQVEVLSGRRVSVNIGQEQVHVPEEGATYKLLWGQDGNGDLCVTRVEQT